MPARVQVVVEAKDASGGIFRALTSQLGQFGSLIEEVTAKNVNWGNVAQMGVQMVANGMKQAVDATMKYAQEVRDLSLASGQSAEASSRMLQVLDDYQLSADDAKTATRALTKEGLAPTIDTIASLSAQFVQLSGVEERNAFVQKNLGRAGQEWLNLLSQGPDAIHAMNDAVNQNLILTEDQIQATEEYRLAMDQLGDTTEGLKIQLGSQLIPVLNNYLSVLNDDIRAMQIMDEQGINWFTATREQTEAVYAQIAAENEAIETKKADAVAMDTAAQSASELAAAEKEAAEAAKQMDVENKQFLGVLGNVKTAQDAFNKGMAEADAALKAGDMTTKEHSAAVNQLSADYQAASKQIVLSIVEMKLAADGWTDAELNAYLQIGENMGAFTKQQVSMAKGAIAAADQIVAGSQNVGDQVFHTGERAVDAAKDFGVLGRSGEELAEKAYEAAGGVGAVKSQISGLPPNGSAWDYTFNIHTNGRVPSLPGMSAGAGAEGAAGGTATQGTGTGHSAGRQMGGEVYAGQPTWVGEGGREPFIPAMNGRILSHAEALHQMSLGGGGGGTNYFYGPVTLQISEDSAGGLMSVR